MATVKIDLSGDDLLRLISQRANEILTLTQRGVSPELRDSLAAMADLAPALDTFMPVDAGNIPVG